MVQLVLMFYQKYWGNLKYVVKLLENSTNSASICSLWLSLYQFQRLSLGVTGLTVKQGASDQNHSMLKLDNEASTSERDGALIEVLLMVTELNTNDTVLQGTCSCCIALVIIF